MRTQRSSVRSGPSPPAHPSAPAPENATAPSPSGSHGDRKNGFDTRELLRVLLATRNGDFSVRLPSEWAGIDGKSADAFNDIMLANQTMAGELERLSRAVGREGQIRQSAAFSPAGRACRRTEERGNPTTS